MKKMNKKIIKEKERLQMKVEKLKVGTNESEDEKDSNYDYDLHLNNVLISGGLSFDTLEPFNCTSSKHF